MMPGLAENQASWRRGSLRDMPSCPSYSVHKALLA